MSVGENIKKIRLERGMQQAELAERAGITQAMLSQVERGIKNPSLQVGREMAIILRCHIEDFFE